MTESLKVLLEKDMDRREFLLYAGSVALGVIGVSGLIKTVTQPLNQSSTSGQGYGSSVYGGKK